jgi:GR25 family glycosyltransferase involved in LPS biosynthesis
MKALVIQLKGQYFDELQRSVEKHNSRVYLESFRATSPDTIKEDTKQFPWFKWAWPMHSQEDGLDMKTGLYKFAYKANDQQKKIACSVSHMRAWQECIDYGRPMYVFESDAILTRELQPHYLTGADGNPKADIIGLNDPRGATRRALTFHGFVSARHSETQETIHPVPNLSAVGEPPVPHGLAGNSAYYITPVGAKKLLEGAKEYGMYPNDAFMCKELFPWIRTAYPYFTKVSGVKSTTVN